MMKIENFRKAVSKYNYLNKGGAYSPHYGCLMIDLDTLEMWCDEFYDSGRGSYVMYNDNSVVNLRKFISENNIKENEVKKIIPEILIEDILEHEEGYKIKNLEDFNYSQLYQIRIGLRDGLDVEVYADPEFDYLQMEQIRVGLEAELDVSKYASPEIDVREMRKIKKQLESESKQPIFSTEGYGPEKAATGKSKDKSIDK